MESLENQIRRYTTEEILGQLEINQQLFNSFGLVVLCDELLLRSIPIQHLTIRYEKLVKSLSRAELKYIDKNDANFSKATLMVVYNEMKQRGIRLLEWFYSVDGVQSQGPHNRQEIGDLIKKGSISEQHFLWKEGTVNWLKLEDLKFFKKKMFFDQEFKNQSYSTQEEFQRKNEPEPTPRDPRPFNKEIRSKGNNVITGVMELASLPFWIVSLFFVFFAGYDTEIGGMIPFLFALFATMAAVPVGIGLLMNKKWAWSIKVSVAAMTILLVLLKSVFDDAIFIWTLFAIYQGIILFFLLSDKESFEDA